MTILKLIANWRIHAISLLKTLADWRPRTPFYYGWLILAMSAVGTYAATGSTQLVFGGVQNFIFEDMGWDRSTIAYAVTAGTWASGLITPFVGRLADRYGPRGLMPIAAFIAGVAFFAIAGMQAVWHFYAAYIVARTIASPMLVGVVPRTAAVNFFSRRRNLALGISAMARPFGGAINIQIFSLIAIATSWRTAFQVQGIISLLIVIPLFLVMRRSPSDIGLRPDGASESAEPRSRRYAAQQAQLASRPEQDWSAGQAARTPAFWLIIIAESLVILMSGTIHFQIVPYLRDVGVSHAVAAGALSISSLLGSLGNPFWGWLSDLFSPRRLALITLAISGAAVSLFLIVPEGRVSVAVVILYGTIAGGLNILGHMMIAQYFGRSSFGSITGLMGPFQTGALGLGPTLGAIIYRITGGYRAIYLFGVLSYILAFACIIAARPPRLPNQ
ncbi:MAG: MFS transporter [Chloroflexi bacterium]|nr:MFS transporter [Chloroflexota bacterium]